MANKSNFLVHLGYLKAIENEYDNHLPSEPLQKDAEEGVLQAFRCE